jgi:hypothetical protein
MGQLLQSQRPGSAVVRITRLASHIIATPLRPVELTAALHTLVPHLPPRHLAIKAGLPQAH